jgi:ankyrin repeat protein
LSIQDDEPAIHHAIEMEDLDTLRDLIANGADIELVYGGLSPLQHALDIEICTFRADEVWHVDLTSLILGAGADPTRVVGHRQETALQMAEESGHWMAVAVLKGWIARNRPAADTI